MNAKSAGIHAYATDNRQDLPATEHWYNLAGPAGSAQGAAIRAVIGQTGLKSEVGSNGVIAARVLNDHLGDNPEITRCPDDQGDAFHATIDNAYEDYGTSYQHQWEDGVDAPFFGVVKVFGQSQLDGAGNRSIVAGFESANLDRGVRQGGTLYNHAWSEKILLGDFNWHGNRTLSDPKNQWHLSTSATTRISPMLFGDGHVEYYRFPDNYGPLNLPVNPSVNGFW